MRWLLVPAALAIVWSARWFIREDPFMTGDLDLWFANHPMIDA